MKIANRRLNYSADIEMAYKSIQDKRIKIIIASQITECLISLSSVHYNVISLQVIKYYFSLKVPN